MRLAKPDTLRGLTLISMVLYHTVWDLVYIFHWDYPWYNALPGFIWQQSICWTFILLSGFSWSLGKKHLKRGLTVFICGALITLATYPLGTYYVVWFGILTFMGTAMLILIPLDKLLRPGNRQGAVILVIVSFLLFILTRDINSGRIFIFKLPSVLYSNYITSFLGFPFPGFGSTDYFSVLPWIFLYITGYGLYHLIPLDDQEHPLTVFLSKSVCPPLEFIGRHTLVIYMVHQPVIYLIISVIGLIGLLLSL